MTMTQTCPIFAFVHIEKTAGSSIIRVLRREFGVHHWDALTLWRINYSDYFSKRDYERLSWIYPRLYSLAGHDIKPYSDLAEILPNLYFYTFLRDPIQRCVSQYQQHIDLKNRKYTLKEFLQTKEFRNYMTKRLGGGDDNLNAAKDTLREMVFVGLTERFDESLLIFQKIISPYHNINIYNKKINVASKTTVRDQIFNDSKNMLLLEDANSLDIELYQFTKEELYPQQVKQYGPHISKDLKAFQSRKPTVPTYETWRILMNRLKRNLIYKPVRTYYRIFHKNKILQEKSKEPLLP